MACDSWDDYYVLLGVDASADAGELRRAWRQRALRWHPDHAGPGAKPAFQMIQHAYAVLSDPVARAEYDRRRGPARAAPPRPPAATPATPAAAPRRRAPGVMLHRLTGQLTTLLCCGIARRVPGAVGTASDPELVELFLDAGEAAEGGMASISLRVALHCPGCASAVRSCARCGGRGTIEELFTAWLAVPPGVDDGTELRPTVLLPGMVRPVSFRVRLPAGGR